MDAKMLRLIVWLTTCVFLCGAIAYLNWFCVEATPRIHRRWHESISENAQAASAEPDSSSRPDPNFIRRLLTFLVGACFSGFLFAGTLHGYLPPPERPIVPDASLGYVYFFNPKHSGVYGTYFEYLVVNYGIWVTWGSALLIGLIAIRLKINLYDSPAYALLFLVGSATSMTLCFALWQACLYMARA
jgi:hypothetical protein